MPKIVRKTMVRKNTRRNNRRNTRRNRYTKRNTKQRYTKQRYTKRRNIKRRNTKRRNTLRRQMIYGGEPRWFGKLCSSRPPSDERRRPVQPVAPVPEVAPALTPEQQTVVNTAIDHMSNYIKNIKKQCGNIDNYLLKVDTMVNLNIAEITKNISYTFTTIKKELTNLLRNIITMNKITTLHIGFLNMIDLLDDTTKEIIIKDENIQNRLNSIMDESEAISESIQTYPDKIGKLKDKLLDRIKKLIEISGETHTEKIEFHKICMVHLKISIEDKLKEYLDMLTIIKIIAKKIMPGGNVAGSDEPLIPLTAPKPE